MARFHFVEDYRRLVAELLSQHPLDEAMSRAVGGAYDGIGALERDILLYAGLRSGMAVIDLGCGSGRLAHALGKSLKLNYCGIDVVQDLLDYAVSKSPPHYRFVLNESLTLPVPTASADFFVAFSVFTHLLHSESYLYLEEAKRVLRPGGTVVFSFLEFADPNHWEPFLGEVNTRRGLGALHLNIHIERPVVEIWAKALGYRVVEFIGGGEAPWRGSPLGQSVAVLRPA